MYAFAITLIEENLLLLSFYKDLDKNTFFVKEVWIGACNLV